jgi:hypothetical protein
MPIPRDGQLGFCKKGGYGGRGKKTGLDLAELLPVLRSEIDKAVENLNKSGKGALFDLKEAQVEVHFVVTKEVESGAKGGVPMVFAVELGGSYGTERDNYERLIRELR